MKTLDLQQGSAAWKAARAGYRTASEAPAMTGTGKVSRNDLLQMKATGSEKEFSDWVENVLFARGHEIEAKARPFAEDHIGEELYPVTGVDDDDYLLASFDGITMDEQTIWECKQWNESKAQSVREQACPVEDYWQVVHQFAVSGAQRCVYTLSDGTLEGTLHLGIERSDDDIRLLMAAWRQFDEDLAQYQPREAAPEVIGRAPEALPALSITVKGEVTQSNLGAFKDHALAVFEGINTDLKTDTDFANAEKTVKWCEGVEGKLDAAKEHALSQTASIDDLFRTIDSIKEEARAKRLELEKLVKARKAAIRLEIITEAKAALAQYVETINQSLPVPIPAPTADFAAAIKGKRTVSSLRDAADTLLAQSKIAASETAERVRANIGTIDAADAPSLFADRAQLALKDLEHVELVVKSRVAEHKAAEERRITAEREQIRREEEAKARREAAAEQARIQSEEEAEARRKATEEAEERAQRETAEPVQAAPDPQPVPTTSRPAPAPKRELTVTITDSEYRKLKADSALLDALHAAGVDSWDGYGQAIGQMESAA